MTKHKRKRADKTDYIRAAKTAKHNKNGTDIVLPTTNKKDNKLNLWKVPQPNDGVEIILLCNVHRPDTETNPRIEKTILTAVKKSYQIKYEKSNLNENNSTRHQNEKQITVQPSCTIDQFGMNRCYLEDYMVIEPGAAVMVIIPKNNVLPDVKRLPLKLAQVISFGYRKTFYVLHGEVTSNVYKKKVSDGIDPFELKRGLGYHKYGAYIELRVEDVKIKLLITWQMVLSSQVQVWTRIMTFRDPYLSFHCVHRD